MIEARRSAVAVSTAMADMYRRTEVFWKTMGTSPYPNYNSPATEYDASFRAVTGRPLHDVFRDVRSKFGRVVLLNVGSNNDPFREYLQPGDVSITVGLQDHDAGNEFLASNGVERHFVPGSIAIPQTWEDISSLMKRLKQNGNIPDSSVNFVIGKINAGWDSIPTSARAVRNVIGELQYLESLGCVFDSSVRKTLINAQNLDSKELEQHGYWLAQQFWDVLGSNGGTILLDTPQHSRIQLNRLIQSARRGGVMIAATPNAEYIYAIKTPNSPRDLPFCTS